MMENFKNWVAENYFWIITIFLVIIFVNNCSQTNKQLKINDKLVKQNVELVQQLDSLKHLIPTQEILLLQYRKEKYEFLKLSLYDWNTIVRTTARPDDVIRKYDDEIKKINEKLLELK